MEGLIIQKKYDTESNEILVTYQIKVGGKNRNIQVIFYNEEDFEIFQKICQLNGELFRKIILTKPNGGDQTLYVEVDKSYDNNKIFEIWKISIFRSFRDLVGDIHSKSPRNFKLEKSLKEKIIATL